MAAYWYQENLRFLQTVLRETDIINYDASAVVGYMERVNANVLVVNAGGVIDFFKNPLEMANPNRFMKDEILPELCEKIHRAGKRLITRVDFRGVEARRFNLHPDWFALDQDGNTREGISGNVKLARPCYNSPYIQEYAPAFIDYLLAHYDIDGIWENALGFDNSPCYCKKCRDLYRKETGKEIPPLPPLGNRPGAPGDLAALDSPVFAEYRAWKEIQADRHINLMRGAVKKHGEEKAFCAEIFDLYHVGFTRNTGISHQNAKKSFDFIISCVFLNAKHSPEQSRVYDIINNAATTILFSRALAPQKQPVIVTGGNGTRWRYAAAPLLENRLWMWHIAGAGGGIWNCYFNGQSPALTHDRRGAYSERDVYTYLAENSALLSHTVPAADVLIYYSTPTKEHLRDEYGAYIRGIERVLLENHIQYGFIPDSELTLRRLKGAKALLLPNTAYISDRDMEIFRQYVREGGGLVASKNAALFDEGGNPRGDFGLGELLGVSYTGLTLDTAEDTYQLIRDKGSPVLKGIGDTDILANGGSTLLVTLANRDYQVAATHIPAIPNQPPEYAWIPEMKTEYPTIVSGQYGQGRVVYFANGIEALAFLNGHEDYTEIYKNALDFASGGFYLLNARAPRSVHISVINALDDENHLVLAMINTTGTSQRPQKEAVPVPAELRIPLRGRIFKGARVLWGEGVTAGADKNEVLIRVEALGEFAALELCL